MKRIDTDLKRLFLAGTAVLLAATAAGLWSARAQNAARGPFTDAQAEAGRAAYAQNCARCHDSGEAPPLSGAAFLGAWGNRSTRDLFSRIKDTMPVDNPGILDNDSAASITAFLLKNNGAAAGTAALTPTTAVAINTIITPQQTAGATRQGGNGSAAA